MIDNHIHSYFSPDSTEKPENIISAAVKAGLSGIAITDHLEVGHENLSYPLEEYFRVWNAARVNAPIDIKIGIEVGYDPLYIDEISSIVNAYPFEHIISSIHHIRGIDPYSNTDFYYSFPKDELYEKYLQAVSESLDAPYAIHAVGHIGYIERYAPYSDPSMNYLSHKKTIDEIIAKLIAKNIALEFNTNASSFFQPRADFIKAYLNAGGNNIILSSDAHTVDHIAQHFNDAKDFLQGLGYKIN